MAGLGWRRRERTFALAAGDAFFESVAMGTFAALAMNALPLWRRRCDPRDVAELRRRLVEEPCAYVLFPEGTRTRTGEMGAFKAGLGRLVAGTGVPVVPGYVAGAFEAMPAGARWPRARKVEVTFGDAMTFGEVADDKGGWTEVARRCEEAVRGLAVAVSRRVAPPRDGS
jgi:1-acyl-sn-glycerol-3-phosphate acyltransferase